MIRAITEPTQARYQAKTVTLEFSGGDAEMLHFLSLRNLSIPEQYEEQTRVEIKSFLDRLAPILYDLGVRQ